MSYSDYLALRCSFPLKEGGTCARTLSGEAWATSCAHVFCNEHAHQWFEAEDRCPVCLDKEQQVRVCKVRASGENENKVKQLLIGLSPPEVQLASSTALNFWVQQKFVTFLQEQEDFRELDSKKKRIITGGRRRLADADALLQTLTASRDELKRQVQDAERELAGRKEELTTLRTRLSRTQQAVREGQSRAAGLTPRPSEAGSRSPGVFELGRAPTPAPALPTPRRASMGCGDRSTPGIRGSARSRSPLRARHVGH